jgi:putative transposase
MKYQVIAQNAQDYPIKLMCQTLEVSESGYHAWKWRPLSHRAQADQQIASHI